MPGSRPGRPTNVPMASFLTASTGRQRIPPMMIATNTVRLSRRFGLKDFDDGLRRSDASRDDRERGNDDERPDHNRDEPER